MAGRWLPALFRGRKSVEVAPKQGQDVQKDPAVWEVLNKAKSDDFLADGGEASKLEMEREHCVYQLHFLRNAVVKSATNMFLAEVAPEYQERIKVYEDRIDQIDRAIEVGGRTPWIQN